MVDRKARDELAALLQSYMDEKITAFQLDEGIWRIADVTSDQTLNDMAPLIWCFYDDLKDHKIVASKEAWDCLSRIILMLRSDAERVVIRRGWRWRAHHVLAAASLVAYFAIAMKGGWDSSLMLCAIPFGLISMLLAWWREQAEANLKSVLVPFPSVGSLLEVRRSVPHFCKRRYPRGIAQRTIRTPWASFIVAVPAWIGWLLFSPVMLFLQMLPSRVVEITVSLPER